MIILTCPRCNKEIDETKFKDIYDRDTGSWDIYILCTCGFDEYTEALEAAEIPF